MDRAIVWPSQVPQDTDVLNSNRFAMIGLGVMLQAILGPGPYVDGLACTPGSGLTVAVGAGSIYVQAQVDPGTYGSLAADTTDLIVKQGITFGAVSSTLTAPGTAGQSVVWLIECQLQETDTSLTTLPYYNSGNPLMPIYTAQNAVRKASCVLQAKAGTAAATGSQVAPTPDSGWTPLWTVTVANGQATIVGGNIALAAGAPFILTKLPGCAPILNAILNNPSLLAAPPNGDMSLLIPSTGWVNSLQPLNFFLGQN